MHLDAIPAKTAAGHAEVGCREMDLPWRARALLVAIRGERSIAQLREQFGGKDLEVLLEGLEELGLIAYAQPAQAERGLALQAMVPDESGASRGLRAFLFRRAMPE